MPTNITYIIGAILSMVVGMAILLYGPIVSGYVIDSAEDIQSDIGDTCISYTGHNCSALGADTGMNDTIDDITGNTWTVYQILGVVFIFIAIGLLLLGLMGGFAPVLAMVNRGF